MLESAGKVPNTLEHVEVVSSDIHEDERNITFTFKFARGLRDDEITDMYRDPHRMFHQIIFGKLHEKRWTEAADKGQETVLVPFSFESAMSEGGKTWTMHYRRSGRNR